MKNRIPKTAKGTMRKIEVSCAAWIDLLGYGAMLEDAEFDITDPKTESAVKRLETFHKLIAKSSCRYFPTFVLNDGAIAFRDLSPRSASVTYDFVRRAYNLFLEINDIEIRKNGYPGARMIIAAGFRLRREIDFDSVLYEGKGKKIKQKLADGRISQEQALNEALKTRNTHDIMPELQGNFALTKAYLADRDGKAGGFAGPNCFIDMALFDSPLPSWLTVRHIIEWKSGGLSGAFRQIERIDGTAAAADNHKGIRDAFVVANELSNAENVDQILKATRVTRSR